MVDTILADLDGRQEWVLTGRLRLYIVDIGKLHIPWATQVVDLKISGRIRSTMTQLHNMAAMPWCVFGDRLKACAAAATLL